LHFIQQYSPFIAILAHKKPGLLFAYPSGMNKHDTSHVPTRASLAAVFALAFAGPALSQQTLALQECIHAGLKGNFDLQRLEQGTELAQSRIDEAKSNYYPNLKASGTLTNLWDKPYSLDYQREVGSRWTMGGGLTLTQPLYMQPVLTGIKISRKTLELDGLSKKAQRDGVVQQLAMLYWTTVYLEENQAVLNK